MSYLDNINAEGIAFVRRYKNVDRPFTTMTDSRLKHFRKLVRYVNRADGRGN